MALAAPTELDLNTTEGIKSYIAIEAQKQGVDATLVENVVRCESGFKGTAIGDGGLAVGLAQFHYETFYRLQKKSGIDLTAEREDYRAQIKILIWSIANGHGNEWTCYRKQKTP